MVEFERKICWPRPDATCLEGGCGYCNDGKWKTFTQIERYVTKVGILSNRGVGEKPAADAWRTGLENGFFGRSLVREHVSRDTAGRSGGGE